MISLWPGWLASLLAMTSVEPPAAIAYSEVAVFDGASSSAAFSVRVLWTFDVNGQFGSVHGNVQIDRAANQAIVDARIDANAVRMPRNGTENWVKSDEFFNVAKYPEIRFLSAPFPLSRLQDGGDLPGSLSLRGFNGPVVFKVQPATCARPAFDCAVEAVGSIRRGAFGMRSRKGTLSDKVELSMSIRVREVPAESPSP